MYRDCFMITFVYKTEVSNSLDGNHFKSPRRNVTDKKETSNELCSHAENEVNKLCSNNYIDTCGVLNIDGS